VERNRLDRVQRAPGITLRVVDERVDGRPRERQPRLPDPFAGLFRAALDQGADMFRGELFQDEYATPGEQRAGELEARVLGGGPDQRDDAVLHPGKERILLGPVEPVNLVAEQDRAPPLILQALLGLLDDLAHARHALGDRGERLEMPVRVVRDDLGEGGFSRAGRPPEDAAALLPPADEIAQRASRPQEVFLAEEVAEGARAEARGQRLRRALEERSLGVNARLHPTPVSWPRTSRPRQRTRPGGANRACPGIRVPGSRLPRTA